MQPSLRASYAAAALAGFPILVAFFVWHWFSLAATWGVLIEAAVAYPLGIAGVGWAWRVARRAGSFASRWGGVGFACVFIAGLFVSEAVGLWRGRAETTLTFASIGQGALFASLALVPVVHAGWRIAGGRGAAAFAAAGLPLDLHLGGTVMNLGGRGVALSLLAVLVATYLLAGVILPRAEGRLARQATATGRRQRAQD